MRITIKQLGPIIEANIDLKPLTIFVGPNNMGKTWLAYSIANIFSPLSHRKYVKEYLNNYEEDAQPGIYLLLENAIKQIENSGITAIDMLSFADQYAEVYFNNIAHSIKSSMAEFMATQLTSFQSLNISIDLIDTKKKLLEQILASSLKTEISGSQEKPLLTIRKKRGDKNLLAYTITEYSNSDEYTSDKQSGEEGHLPLEVIRDTLIETVLRVLHRSLYPNVRILPTERTTYIALPWIKRKVNEADEPEIQKLIKEAKNSITGPSAFFLSMIIQTLSISTAEIKERAKDALRNPKIRKYIQLAEVLEKEILGGEIKFAQKELDLSLQEIEQKILFQATKDSTLEISLSSSMVKELSPLVLYLRYTAKPNELIVIDEPEMNLHPEAQVKMIEFLAMLVHAGLNILITTHSPYLIDHLANLIKAAEVEDKESIRNQFYLKQTEAFIAKDDVSIYLFNQGHVTQALNEEGEIDLSTFGDISDRISEIYFEL